MSKRETVQNPLSARELREWHITILSQLPDNPDPVKVRADLKNKTALGRDCTKFFSGRYTIWSEFPDAAKWVDFYRRHFDKEVDLTNLHVAVKPDYPCWPIVMVPGITNNDAFAACQKAFGAWRYTNDLNSGHDVVQRPNGAYVVWVKQNVEADPDLASVSANQITERALNVITLRERLILELSYFDETKQHLDIENWTLCAGSRRADGYVPHVAWYSYDRQLLVDWRHVDNAYPDLRARAAVSP